MEYFKYFGSKITNDARCISGFKSWIAMTIWELIRRLSSPTNWALTCRKKLPYIEQSFVWCWNLDNSESRLEKSEDFKIWCRRRIEEVLLLLLSVGLPVANAPDVLQQCGLFYYTWCSNSHHQSSPQGSWQSEVELNLIIFRRSNFHH